MSIQKEDRKLNYKPKGLDVVLLEKGGNSMAKSKVNENAIEVIFDQYEEVRLNQNGFTVTFKNKDDILDAFKALTKALDEMDRKKNNQEMGFSEEK